MKRKRRDRRHKDCLDLPVGEVDEKDVKRRDTEFLLAFFGLILLIPGGLTVLAAMQTAANVRRLTERAIVSASALRGAVRGQPVVLSGRIDPKSPVSAWDLAIYYGERLEQTKRTSRYGTSGGQSAWFRYGPARRPPFTLVTGEARLPINGYYAIEQPSVSYEFGRLRFSGFRPGDEVLVIGTTLNGGISVDRVYGGTLAEFWKTRGAQADPIVGLRGVGFSLMGLGLLLFALWVPLRIGRRIRDHRATFQEVRSSRG
jgi:hypothetical protein